MPALRVISEARKCTICAEHLPFEPRPILAGSTTARLLIIGQAPGKAAHDLNTPWQDRSGDRLRDWLNLTNDQFLDPSLVALVPMGFCFPGKGKSGDAPPRPECAPKWHDRILRGLTSVELTIFIGKYAFDRYLSPDFETMSEAVRGFKKLLPDRIALPHPSPRNNIWLSKNPWFQTQSLPALRKRTRRILA